MNESEIQKFINKFLHYCQLHRRLSPLTVRSYGFDLTIFVRFTQTLDPPITQCAQITKGLLGEYLDYLSIRYKVRTIKRKFACLRSLMHYLEYEEIIEKNPFNKFHLQIKEGSQLPKTMDLHEVDLILQAAYTQEVRGPKEEFLHLRDIAILELLFAGGLRVGELCSLTFDAFDERNFTLLIKGKGDKERLIFLANNEVRKALTGYLSRRKKLNLALPYLFTTKFKGPMSTQGVRNLVTKYVTLAGISKNITPHVFRHSFASLLLEEGVDIKYIQEFLGHSSLSTTQIYLHTSREKQMQIMSTMHPREKLSSTNKDPKK